MANKKKGKKVEEYEEEFEEEVVPRCLKIPTYNQKFHHIISRISYRGFLEAVAQLNAEPNGDVLLCFGHRKIVDQAWEDLVMEAYEGWKTDHSEVIREMALRNALAQPNASLYDTFCVKQINVASNLTSTIAVEAMEMIFKPIVVKYNDIYKPIQHPKKMFRLVELPRESPEPEKPKEKRKNKKRGRKADSEDDYKVARGGEDDENAVAPIVLAIRRSNGVGSYRNRDEFDQEDL
ncbi:uncharacterized protein LY89DRAFT_729369 [Mollisia scopiformis]|uniref:Uncharacterized protein n=1 Tax=Mollisia scopiformis TaxID=149040 RepID=A0A194XNW4_MOLSC|nr:uncharacterized protein LY89DRAFT_729369 [Mollisia scopiformis]KUJ21873.1 hypothetical protein LY89DRAFT_729369 [Mollisia scopiformis]